jgi:predicted nucleotidyltransferase
VANVVLDPEHREQKLEAGRAVAADYANRPEVDCVFLSGSILAGLGSPTSDVDVFVVSSDSPSETNRQVIHDDTRVDLQFRQVSWLSGLVDHLEFDATLGSFLGESAPVMQDAESFDPAIRLLVSEPVRTSAAYDEALSEIRRHVGDIRQSMIASYLHRTVGALEDVVGFLADRDVASASIVTHEILVIAAQAFLVGSGDMYVGRKWIFPKLARSAPNFPVDRFASLLGHRQDAEIRQGLRFAQACLLAAALDGWDDPQTAGTSVWDTEGAHTRSIEWLPLRMSDAIVISHRRRLPLRLSERALRLWAICGSQPSHDGILRVALDLGMPADNAERMLAMLISKAAIEP